VGLRFSDGGTSPLVRVTSGSKSLDVGFAGVRLPAPTLDGAVATYTDVLPGVDLRLEALPFGYDQRLIIRARPKAAVSWRFPLTLGGGLSAARDTGGRLIFSAAGKQVASADPPLMWGADKDPATGQPLDRVPVATTVTTAGGTALQLDPELGFLTDPEVALPITIDPSPNFGTVGDTYVDSGLPTTSFSAATNMQIGNPVSGTNNRTTRTLIQFDQALIAGKHIISATLKLWQIAAANCLDHGVEVKASAGAFDGSTTWNTKPASIPTVYGSATASDGCPAGWVQTDLTTLTGRWATEAITNHGAYVVAPAANENSHNYWRQFRTAQAAGAEHTTLSMTYTSSPATPTSLYPASGTKFGSLTPAIRAKFTDPDGGYGHNEYELYNNATGVLVATGNGATVASGQHSFWQVPAGTLSDGVTYKWRARGNDGLYVSPWTVYVTFTTDVTPPGAPTVSSTTHPSQTTWYAGTSFAASWPAVPDTGGLAGYGVVLDDQASTVPEVVTQTTTSYSATLSPGISYLHVRAQDQAGNWGPVSHFTVQVQGAITTISDGARTQKYLTLQAKGDPAVTEATFQLRRADADAWTTIPLAGGNVTNGGSAVTTWPVTMTAGASPTLVWNLPATSGIDAADGPVQVRATFTGGPGGTTQTVHATLDQKAFGNDYASDEIGPGTVNLITGNYTVSDTDVEVDSYGSDLTVSRTFNSRDPNATTNGPFGPGWTPSLTVEDAESDYTSLHDAGSYVVVSSEDGTQLAFGKPAAGSTYIPEDDATDLTLTTVTGGFKLADTDGNATTFTKPTGATDYVPTTVAQPGTATATTYTYQVTGGVTRITQALAPVPAGVTCTTLVAGCRALTFTYATSTTATGTSEAQWGDYTGRLKTVSFTAYDPATSAMATVAVASYLYDSTGRLRAAWDPRITPALKTRYAYDAGGHLQTITPPGENAWMLAYATIAGDPDTGRLRSVSRPAIPSGTATTTVAYGIPVSGAGAPYAMGASDLAAWGQADVPTDATAVFPPDQVPADPPTSYTRATVTYVNRDGREVNQADPGGHIITSEHDEHGNTIRELSAANRARALATGSTTADHAERARQLDTQRIYSSDGVELLEEWGPQHLVTLASGEQAQARARTTTIYDEGAPSGGPYHLPTTSKIGARVVGTSTDVDVRTTKSAYDGQSNLGWTLRQPTSVTVDAVAGGLNLTTTSLYDAATGLVTETRMPAGPAGGDAHATRTLYYTAGTHPTDSACGTKPQFANLVCKTLPAAQPGTAGLPDLPVTQTSYNRYNQPTTVTEAVGSTTRTSTTTYDTAGRATDAAITSTVGTALPSVHTGYDPATGRATTTQTTEGGVTSTITRDYDALGRLTGYHDADSNNATTSYDLLDRPVTSYDGKGTQTRTYDTAIDPRGMVTSIADSAAGTFTARYEPDGQLTTQGYPNGMEARTTYDEAGDITELAYVKITSCSSNCTWLSFQASDSIHGQQLTQAGSVSSQTHTYDAVGRLKQVNDTSAGAGCTIRAYGYDADSNRTSQTTKQPAATTPPTGSPAPAMLTTPSGASPPSPPAMPVAPRSPPVSTPVTWSAASPKPAPPGPGHWTPIGACACALIPAARPGPGPTTTTATTTHPPGSRRTPLAPPGPATSAALTATWPPSKTRQAAQPCSLPTSTATSSPLPASTPPPPVRWPPSTLPSSASPAAPRAPATAGWATSNARPTR
jgi:YD repeat-containing protein